MKKINKKIIIGVALLIFVIIGFIVVNLTESDDLQDVNVGSSTRNVYENYTGETIKVDDEVKKQVDSMIVEKRTEAIENKENNELPSQNNAQPLRHKLNNLTHKRINQLNPQYSERSPSKRIKKTYSTINIQRQMAIIPRNRAKKCFLTPRRNIFCRRAN